MLIAVCGLGSIWTSQMDSAGGGKRPVYYNSTGVETAKGLRACAVIYGVVRVDAATGFNPHLPGRLVGRTLASTGARMDGGLPQITLRWLATGSPDAYLVAVRSETFGIVDRTGLWKSDGVEVVSFSEWGGVQEMLLVMRPYTWLVTSRGAFQIEQPSLPAELRSGVLKEMAG